MFTIRCMGGGHTKKNWWDYFDRSRHVNGASYSELPQSEVLSSGVTSPYGFLRVRLTVDPDGHGHRQLWQLLTQLDSFFLVAAAQCFAQRKGKVFGYGKDTGTCDVQNKPKQASLDTNLGRTNKTFELNASRRQPAIGAGVITGRQNEVRAHPLSALQMCFGQPLLHLERQNDTVCNERLAKRQLPSFSGGKTDVSLPTPAAPPESVCPKEPWVVRGENKTNTTVWSKFAVLWSVATWLVLTEKRKWNCGNCQELNSDWTHLAPPLTRDSDVYVFKERGMGNTRCFNRLLCRSECLLLFLNEGLLYFYSDNITTWKRKRLICFPKCPADGSIGQRALGHSRKVPVSCGIIFLYIKLSLFFIIFQQ